MNAAMSCPRCFFPAQPAMSVQQCTACRGTFVLYPGAATDPAIVPPPPLPTTQAIRVRSAGAFEYRFGIVEAFGVAEGALDPVIGRVATEKNGIAWPDVISIAVWRKLDVLELVVALLVPVPLALVFWICVIMASAGFLFLAVPLSLLGAFMIHRAVVRKKNFVRVCGRYGFVTVRFDRPGWRRLRFHSELLRRAGLRDAPIP